MDSDATFENTLLHDLDKIVIDNQIPTDQLILFGSALMYKLGLKKLNPESDLDIFVAPFAWSILSQVSTSETIQYATTNTTNDRYQIGKIEFFRKWLPGNWDFDILLTNTVEIDGWKYASLKDIKSWKQTLGREKDISDIKLIDQYLKTQMA
jgi:hypothetical protein